jgi:DNA-binding phage protein
MTRDARAIIDMLREEIKRVGWSETARRSGLDRTSLHRAFQERQHRFPSFVTVSLVAMALGVKLEARKG